MAVRRSAGWFALILALLGTPARQVEAADDFARTMTELGAGDRVEGEDGGVGDDALEATRGTDPVVTGVADGIDSFVAWPLVATASLAPARRAGLARRGVDRAEVPPDAGRRHARLGCFLF